MVFKPKILIVDDKPENLFALTRTLQKLDVEVIQANSGEEALGLSLEHEFCLAIVDVQMPGMDGYELADLMRGNEATAALPLIFVSAIFSDEYHHRKGYDSGAVDFMSKPFTSEILLSKVKVFIELYNQRRRLQDLAEELSCANATLARRAMQLETVGAIGRRIAAILDLNALLPEVVNLIQERFGFTLVGVWLLNETRDGLVLEACSSFDISPGAEIPLRHGGLAAKSFRSGEVCLENKALASASHTPTPGMRMVGAELAIPLKLQNETLGALDIQSERPQAFSAEDVSALETLALQVVVAIHNANLYSKRQ